MSGKTAPHIQKKKKGKKKLKNDFKKFILFYITFFFQSLSKQSHEDFIKIK